MARVNETFFHTFCGKFGRFVAVHPCLVIILSLIFASGCSYFIKFITVISKSSELYTVRDGIAHHNTIQWQKTWGKNSLAGEHTTELHTRTVSFILSSKHDDNIFTKSKMKKLLQLHNLLFNYTSNGKNLSNVCYRNSKNDNKCELSCFIEYYDFNQTIIDTSFDFYDEYLNFDYLDSNNNSNSNSKNTSDHINDFYESIFSNIEFETNISDYMNSTLSDNNDWIDEMKLNIILCPYTLSFLTKDFEAVYQRAGLPLTCNNDPMLLASLLVQGVGPLSHVLKENKNQTIVIYSYQEYLVYLLIENILSDLDHDFEKNDNISNFSNYSSLNSIKEFENYNFDVGEFNETDINMSTSEIANILWNDVFLSQVASFSEYSDYTKQSDFDFGIMSSTPAYLCSYNYRLDGMAGAGETDYESDLYDFLNQLTNQVKKDAEQDLNMNFYLSAGIRWELKYLSSSEANLPYFCVSCLLLIVYSAVATIDINCFGNMNHICDMDFSQSCLGLFGVLSTLIAIIATFGFVGGILQVPFNSLVLPAGLVLLGIGVDDMYVILHAMRMQIIQSQSQSESQSQIPQFGVNEISSVMKHCGPSIFLTSMTDLAAFIVSAFTSPFNSVLAFCIYTGVGIMFDFMFQVTFFMAIVTLYYNYCNKRGCRYSCCKKRNKNTNNATGYQIEVMENDSEMDEENNDNKNNDKPEAKTAEANESRITLMTSFGKLLFKTPYVAMFVVCGLLCYWLVAVYSILNILHVDVNTTLYLTKDSPMVEFLDDLDKYFTYMGSTVWLCFEKANIDYSDDSIQNSILSLTNEIVNGDDKVSSECFDYDILTHSWMDAYLKYLDTNYQSDNDVKSNMTKQEWYQVLYSQFFNTDTGKKYFDDIWEVRILDDIGYNLYDYNSSRYNSTGGYRYNSTYNESSIDIDPYNLNRVSDEIIIGNEIFNDSRLTQITRSKISIQMTTKGSLNIHGGNMKCFQLLQSMCSKYEKQLGVYVYYAEAPYHELGMVIEQVTRDNVLYTAMCVFIICLLLMQNKRIIRCYNKTQRENHLHNDGSIRMRSFKCCNKMSTYCCNYININYNFVFNCTIRPALFTAVIVFEILVGVVGFVSIAGIPLNLITSLLIAVSIGFSVDNVAHFVFAYTNANIETNININNDSDRQLTKKDERQARSIYALEVMAKPIIIGDVSTIIAIIPLLFSPSQINVHVFWVIFLTMMNGILHAILILPIILGNIGPTYQKKKQSFDHLQLESDVDDSNVAQVELGVREASELN